MWQAYPSPTCMNRAIVFNRPVLVEILRNRESHKDGEAKYKFSPKAVEVTELKET